ncbi:MAG: arylesterase [Paracoccaceae bacterium]
MSRAYGVIRSIRNAGLALTVTLAPVWAEPVTIAALGDSLTQGYGLPPEDGFVPQLQAWLDAAGVDVQMINAGVSGDTTAGGLSRIGWTLTPEVDALIVALGGNDLLRGIDPAVARANLDGILAEASTRGLPVLLIGMDAPSNYGADYEAAFEAMYPEVAAEHGALHHENFLGALAALENREEAVERYMQADRIHPNADGVALIVEEIGPRVLELSAKVPKTN